MADEFNEARELAHLLLTPDSRTPPTLVQGVVQAVAADGTISIFMSGMTFPIARVRRLASYIPQANDSVWVLKNGPDLLAIGRVATAAFGVPHSETATGTGAGGTTSSTAYGNLPVAVQIVNFVKVRADSKLMIHATGHCWIDDAIAAAQLAVDVDGTDTEVDSVSSLAAASAHTFAGVRFITGLPAGTIALIKLQWKVSVGTTVATQVGRYSLTVTETF